MNETEFQEIADRTIGDLQDAVEGSGAGIDYEEVGGVLTLEFDNGSKIIFSKQGAMNQLWMAAKSGGFHFNYEIDSKRWICDSGAHEELYAMLSRLATEQAKEEITIVPV